MSAGASIWDKLNRLVLILLFLAGLAGLFFWYLPLIEQNRRYRQRILELDARIQEQVRLSRHLRASIEAVQTDPRTLERMARERLGYARTNETVIRFEAPDSPNIQRR
jgi:cell division protein FtsB